MHICRRTLARVRWPVSHVAPDLAYAVSSLAQASPTTVTWKRARQLKLVVVMPLDASFAKEPDLES